MKRCEQRIFSHRNDRYKGLGGREGRRVATGGLREGLCVWLEQQTRWERRGRKVSKSRQRMALQTMAGGLVFTLSMMWRPWTF